METTITLFNKRVRKKRKSFFQTRPYYELDNITLKEKVFTFLYNLERTGFTTQGEMNWSERIMRFDIDLWNMYEELFKKEYIQFIKTVN